MLYYQYSQYLQNSLLSTTNISQSLSVYILVNSETTSIFINKSFVDKHHLNTWKLSKPIFIYNMNRISNKASQISKVVDIVLQYKTYIE